MDLMLGMFTSLVQVKGSIPLARFIGHGPSMALKDGSGNISRLANEAAIIGPDILPSGD